VRVVVLHTMDALEDPRDPVLDQVCEALRELGHHATLLAIGAQVDPIVAELHAAQPELVFNMAESFAGKSALESNVAALLNLMGMHYTGSSPAGLLLAGDKTLTKKVLSFHGIKTPEFATVYRGALDHAGDLQFPVIVKPPQEDASLGITSGSVVRDLQGLFERIDALQSEFHQPVLLERFVEGREFYVGVIGNLSPEALPIIELDFSSFPVGMPKIASWEAKWGDDGRGAGEQFAGTKSIFPENLPAELVARMQRVAVDAFEALRLRDYGRIDLRVDAEGEVFVIEVNPNCYLERESEFARAAARHGLEYPALIKRLLDLAMARYSQ
jgi:D-alanine-D-alanine ligase